ncbi:hypothetical protein BGM19_20255 [Streptomyces agglomeratus]|uniref:Uncharacterized protein n=1 Tax=Streptomyces agglomeratus TaxID=285458 RepID=A0A1E5P8N3_9ACTN|nr:hypothetical protein [Streptomyces agglomeratus]OEJ25890.1 hypothetical protein AS594_16680 [Streptomyces agglomeratus]OEJ52604.1 hypothetical protein BGK72_19350 [Streptomyces agglomeratus]OEJ59972.1 hypothetical protein BGM19_20255 [Streptomyces agglomeratus]
MTTRTRYHARLHRIGRWWAVDIPEVAVHTQCRTLDEAEDMARDAIAEALGTVPDTIAVELAVPEFAPLLEGVLEARTRRAAADAAELRALADAARSLVEDLGVSQNDAGRLLGLSHQDVSRLSTARGAAESRPWRLGPLSAPGGQAAPGGQGRPGGQGGPPGGQGPAGPRAPVGPGAPGPGRADGYGSSDGGTIRPNRRLHAPTSRPAWAVRDDDADAGARTWSDA